MDNNCIQKTSCRCSYLWLLYFNRHSVSKGLPKSIIIAILHSPKVLLLWLSSYTVLRYIRWKFSETIQMKQKNKLPAHIPKLYYLSFILLYYFMILHACSILCFIHSWLLDNSLWGCACALNRIFFFVVSDISIEFMTLCIIIFIVLCWIAHAYIARRFKKRKVLRLERILHRIY